MSYNHSVGIGGFLRWDFGNFFIYSTIRWRNRTYSPISITKYNNPLDAHVQIAWQPTRQLYVSVALPYYCGTKKDTTITQTGNYSNTVTKEYKSFSLRPWILISWTLRKNAKESIINKMPNI